MDPPSSTCHTCGQPYCFLPDHENNLFEARRLPVEAYASREDANIAIVIAAGHASQQRRQTFNSRALARSPPRSPAHDAVQIDYASIDTMISDTAQAERNFGGSRRPGDSQQRGTSPMGTAPPSQEVIDDRQYWEQEKYTKLSVKGSFLPLVAQPRNLGLADWLAHKCAEEYRVLEALIKILQERNAKNNNMTICNPHCCPSMSAGKNYTYTWLNSQKEPVKVPAIQYISLVQRWIVGKLSDPRVFPCEPLTGTAAVYASGGLNTAHANTPIPAGPTTSGLPLSELAGHSWIGKDQNFPENFVTDVKTIWRQMFRIYAHIYHSHWVNPFWHLSGSSEKATGYPELNAVFCNFISAAKLYCLLSDKDMEPMQKLIDIWTKDKQIPEDAIRGDMDISRLQSKLRSSVTAAGTPLQASAQ